MDEAGWEWMWLGGSGCGWVRVDVAGGVGAPIRYTLLFSLFSENQYASHRDGGWDYLPTTVPV